MTTLPLHHASANQLIEQYIGTAYETVKSVASVLPAISQVNDNLNDIAVVAGLQTQLRDVSQNIAALNSINDNLTDINTIADISSAISTLASINSNLLSLSTVIPELLITANNSQAISDVGTNINSVVAVDSNSSNIAEVVNNLLAINALVDSLSDVNAVSTNLTEISAVFNSISEILTINSNLLAINAVSNDIADVIAVAGISTDVSTTAGISADISLIAQNLPDLLNATNVITLTNVFLSLTVSTDPEVQGSNYNTLTDALNYARTVLQADGLLNITIPSNTTISETQPFLAIDKNHSFRLEINGDDINTSIINLQSGGLNSINDVSIANVTINPSGAVALTGSNNVIISNSIVNGPLTINQVNSFSINQVSITDSIQPLVVTESVGSVNQSTFTTTAFNGNKTCIRATQNSRLTIGSNIYNDDNAGLGIFDSVLASAGTEIYVTSPDSSSSSYNPPENTYGNLRSRISTV